MPWIVLYAALITILRAVRKSRAQRPRGLCSGCSFVHMQYGATGRNAVFCTFGGGVRLVKLDVLYCTDYHNRNAPARVVRIGFTPETSGVEGEGERRCVQRLSAPLSISFIDRESPRPLLDQKLGNAGL